MKKETVYKAKDVAILRESLAWAYKKAPPLIKQKIHNDLLRFADSIKTYCQCEDTVYINGENKWACLNCGARYNKDNKDNKGLNLLEVIE